MTYDHELPEGVPLPITATYWLQYALFGVDAHGNEHLLADEPAGFDGVYRLHKFTNQKLLIEERLRRVGVLFPDWWAPGEGVPGHALFVSALTMHQHHPSPETAERLREAIAKLGVKP